MQWTRLVGFLAASVASVAAFGVVAAPAGGAPGTGCPPRFEIRPESFLGDGSVGKVVDVNNDDLVCIRFLGGAPNQGVFVFIDNVVP